LKKKKKKNIFEKIWMDDNNKEPHSLDDDDSQSEQTSAFDMDSRNKSPKSQALELKDLQIEQRIIESQIEEKACALASLQKDFEHSVNQHEWNQCFGKHAFELQNSLHCLTQQKNMLDVELITASEQAEQSALLFETEQLESAMKAVEKIKRITISVQMQDSRTIRRTIKPVRLYSDLVCQIETLFSSKLISLLNEAGDTVGSQDELVFSYEDLIKRNAAVLNLKAEVAEKVSVPSSSPAPKEDSELSIVRKVGRWDFAEVLLFQDGLKLFGEGNWADIAKHIGTRDRVQVRQFADTHRAKKFKITPLHETYADAIRGLRVAVDGVRDIQRDDLVEEREE
jgi:hypothetical protein